MNLKTCQVQELLPETNTTHMIGGRWGQIVDEPLEAGEAGQGGAASAH